MQIYRYLLIYEHTYSWNCIHETYCAMQKHGWSSTSSLSHPFIRNGPGRGTNNPIRIRWKTVDVPMTCQIFGDWKWLKYLWHGLDTWLSAFHVKHEKMPPSLGIPHPCGKTTMAVDGGIPSVRIGSSPASEQSQIGITLSTCEPLLPTASWLATKIVLLRDVPLVFITNHYEPLWTMIPLNMRTQNFNHGATSWTFMNHKLNKALETVMN